MQHQGYPLTLKAIHLRQSDRCIACADCGDELAETHFYRYESTISGSRCLCRKCIGPQRGYQPLATIIINEGRQEDPQKSTRSGSFGGHRAALCGASEIAAARLPNRTNWDEPISSYPNLNLACMFVCTPISPFVTVRDQRQAHQEHGAIHHKSRRRHHHDQWYGKSPSRTCIHRCSANEGSRGGNEGSAQDAYRTIRRDSCHFCIRA
jgi:hypothetical protein